MPGGAVQMMSPQLRDKVSQIAKGADLDAIDRAYQNYSIVRSHSPEAGRPQRNKLSAIAQQAVMLRSELETMSEEARDALWDAIGGNEGMPFYQAMIADLSRLSAAGRQAHNGVEITEGNRRSTKQAFVRNIASILRRSNVQVNAAPNGALCQIVGLLLHDFGDCPKDVRSLVKNALGDN